jgi:hypothetical protein
LYGKVFLSMYKGTLYGHWEAIITMQQLIVLADADGIVDMTPQAIVAQTSIPMDIIEKGLQKLSEPDPYSRTPGEDGKRIILIDEHRPWGWQLVNYAKYKHLKDSNEVREQTRERVRRHREKRNAEKRDVTPSNAEKRYTDTDTDTRKPLGADAPLAGFEIVWKALPKRSGNNPKGKAEKAYRARLSEKHTPAEMIEGAGRYAKYIRAAGKEGTEYVLQGATFLGADKPFLQAWSAAIGGGDWWRTEAGTIAKGTELKLPPLRGESLEDYRTRIRERLAA